MAGLGNVWPCARRIYNVYIAMCCIRTHTHTGFPPPPRPAPGSPFLDNFSARISRFSIPRAIVLRALGDYGMFIEAKLVSHNFLNQIV